MTAELFILRTATTLIAEKKTSGWWNESATTRIVFRPYSCRDRDNVYFSALSALHTTPSSSSRVRSES